MKKELIDSNAYNEEISPIEDLMREHGILNRLLLIYEEIINRLHTNELPISSLKKSVAIIKSFIEDYHEKLEEEYIFPLFEHNKKLTKLTATLRKQHQKGREITAKLQEIVHNKGPLDVKSKKNIINLLKKFITMYRPHEAREDTELFPQVHQLISKQEFDELGEKFEEIEHKLFGKEGFRGILKQVEDIEKELDMYELEKFTPDISKNKQ